MVRTDKNENTVVKMYCIQLKQNLERQLQSYMYLSQIKKY